jgi:AraC-like DNA-binding protein
MNPTQDRGGLELVRIGGAIVIPQILAELGANPTPIIGAAGLSPELLADPESVIPFQALGQLLEECAAGADCDCFGLLLGQRCSAASLGIVGLLVEHSADVRRALDNLARHFHIHDGRGVPILEIGPSTASLGYAVFENLVPGVFDIIDCMVATEFNIMRRLCGSSWRPIEVTLPREKPKRTSRFDSFFEAPIRFGAEHGAVIFPAEWLSQPITGANPLIRELLEERIGKLEAAARESFETQLRRVVRSLVLARRCSLEAVSRLLDMEPRTMFRRLEREQITFRKLVDEIRFEVARHLLADTALAMTEIAALLDYSEATAFARAFRRWSGETPKHWRIAHSFGPGGP